MQLLFLSQKLKNHKIQQQKTTQKLYRRAQKHTIKYHKQFTSEINLLTTHHKTTCDHIIVW